MTVLERHNFGVEPITTHAWNADRQRLAVCLNSKDVRVFCRSKSSTSCDVGSSSSSSSCSASLTSSPVVTPEGWRLEHTLDQHDLLVTGIDWAPRSNRIVTCAADRNAYVWTEDKAAGVWKPTLVLLRINRAASCVKWSPEENKFAVGCGARLISVCYFEQENDWWVSKHIKKPIRSTVTALHWHHNNVLLAAGSTDFKVRVFSAYIKDVEPKPSPTCWGAKMPLAQLMHEAPSSGGWVHDVQFSACGRRLAWVCHGSTVTVLDASTHFSIATVYTDQLPYNSICWLSSSQVLVGGHNCRPLIYCYRGGDSTQNNNKNNNSEQNEQLFLLGSLDTQQKKGNAGVSAMRKFQSLDKQSRSSAEDIVLDSVHQNAICGARPVLTVGGASGDNIDGATVTRVSTIGLDGQLVIWDTQSLNSAMSNLKVH